jgi:hypothetical protein
MGDGGRRSVNPRRAAGKQPDMIGRKLGKLALKPALDVITHFTLPATRIVRSFYVRRRTHSVSISATKLESVCPLASAAFVRAVITRSST